MLILDLDNTIFETKSISKKIFQSIINLIEAYYHSCNQPNVAKQVIKDLWISAMDEVFEKYDTPEKI